MNTIKKSRDSGNECCKKRTLISLLNAIHYFAEYLLACSMVVEGEKRQIQENVRKMYEKIYPRLKDMNAEAYCFPRFPFWG